MTYRELRDEYDSAGIGPQLWDLIKQVTVRVARTYRVDLYNEGRPWNDDSTEVLAQEVAVFLFADDRQQLDEIFDRVEHSRPDERTRALGGLIGVNVKRTLRKRRRVTPVDRLIARIKQIVAEPPYMTTVFGYDLTVALSADLKPAGQLSALEVRRGARLIDSLPRINSRPGGQRESKIYGGTQLAEVVKRLVEEFEPIRLSEIRTILEFVLTAWVPTPLERVEEDRQSVSNPEIELVLSDMSQQVHTFVQGLDPVHRMVLIGKSQRISDTELARQAGISRPTLIKRREAVFQRVSDELLSELPGEVHDDAMHELLLVCAELEEAER